MAITFPDNIWTPDAGDDYALTVDLAATADTVQLALTSLRNKITPNYSWNNLPMSDGWSSQGTYPPLRWRFDLSGNVIIQGQIIPRSGYPYPEVFATLPVGARPSIRVEIPVLVNNTPTRGIAGVLIDTNGNMNVTQSGVGAFSFGNALVAVN